jgi:hypothetical protein
MRVQILPALLAFAGATLSACATPPGGDVAQAEAGSVTCREVLEPPSNVPRRMCATQEGWAEYERGSERIADDFMRRVITSGGVVQ